MTLAEALGAEIDRRRISHREAAEEIGVAQQSFSRWAAGEARPRPEYRQDLIRFLHVSAREYDALWEASGRPRGDRRTAARLSALESEVGELRKVLLAVAARVGVER